MEIISHLFVLSTVDVAWRSLHQIDFVLNMVNHEYLDAQNDMLNLSVIGRTLLHRLSLDASKGSRM